MALIMLHMCLVLAYYATGVEVYKNCLLTKTVVSTFKDKYIRDVRHTDTYHANKKKVGLILP